MWPKATVFCEENAASRVLAQDKSRQKGEKGIMKYFREISTYCALHNDKVTFDRTKNTLQGMQRDVKSGPNDPLKYLSAAKQEWRKKANNWD